MGPSCQNDQLTRDQSKMAMSPRLGIKKVSIYILLMLKLMAYTPEERLKTYD